MPTKLVQYDRIDLIVPDRRDDLVADLRARLGLDVVHVEVGGVDFLRDMAVLKVYYDGQKSDEAIGRKVRLNHDDMFDDDSK